MSYVRFDVVDLADVRFGISPLWETWSCLWALADPARHAVHLPWIKQARPLSRRPDLAPYVRRLTAFAGPKRWLPDFLTPRPAGPLVGFDEEIEALAATPPGRVTADVRDCERNLPLRPFARQVADEPAANLPLIVEAVRVWFDAAIAPYWARMRALLEADVAYRATQLANGGPRLLFDTLHPGTRWDNDRIVIEDRYGLGVDIRGRGFTLTPSVFADRGPLLAFSAWSDPSAIYPVRAVGTLWEGRQARQGGALSGVFGSARARLLALALTPSTTSGLATRTGLTPGAVSQHLAALHAAGLLRRNRQGRAVFYTCTDLATDLLRANGVEPTG